MTAKDGFIAKCSVKGTYYRFLFEEEIFETEKNADDRLKNLQRLPAGEHDKSDYAVAKILGQGFVRGKKLYTVGAFAAFLEADGHVTKLSGKLKTKITLLNGTRAASLRVVLLLPEPSGKITFIQRINPKSKSQASSPRSKDFG